jgi:hypothetical protein
MTRRHAQPGSACLRDCLARYRHVIPELAAIAEPSADDSPLSLIEWYERCFPIVEKAMWSGAADFDALLNCYQSLFREQEDLIQGQPVDDRHDFIMSIPVADRPAHLQACLESIWQLCRRFAYGGSTAGVYKRIAVIVAEDSREQENVQRHIALVDEYRRRGLQVLHFGQAEQYELLHALPEDQRAELGSILTTLPQDKFFLKGQAANRNLSYLKCLQLTGHNNNTLYYMVDSDEGFCVNRQTEHGEQIVYALNYFHAIDKIFRTTDVVMLTGKLVGDPPVSPAVMSVNFLDDVIAFFTALAQTRQCEVCRFHPAPTTTPGDAAYHDMANLFGFAASTNTYPYRCRLDGEHDHAACLADFAAQLNAFFFGVHLTRKTWFRYQDGALDLAPARTVYPGNYIVNREGLRYVIPFGHLRLRMSGPTAGRLIAAEIGKRFASVNLPHLHRRTSTGGLGREFRPGVELEQTKERQIIDLSNEFERQFFGDLMLFTTEQLVTEADVNKPFPEAVIADVIERKEPELLGLYLQKHLTILERNSRLRGLVFESGHWWLKEPGLKAALGNVRAFIDNIEHNFGDRSLAWRQIQSAEHRARRKQQIVEALMNYRSERDAWDRIVA